MNAILLLFLSILTIIILRKILTVFPSKYFIIQDIITTEYKEINLFGFFLRFTLIFIFSLIIAFFKKGNIEFIIIYSFFVSFLLIWPFILNRIIYKNINYEQIHSTRLSRHQVINYLIVYSMYAITCTLVSLLAIPIYNIINQKTMKLWTKLYECFLLKYLSMDPFQQSFISDFILAIVLIIPTFFIQWKLNKFCKKHFK
jgi:hypothetical protein